MYSDLINKIDKAKRYAQEPERFTFTSLEAHFEGANKHSIVLHGEHWICDCNFFKAWHTCSHVMALQQILASSLPATARYESLQDYIDEAELDVVA
jgi:UDP-2,3-diacylglucosamine pyrophosphatase LpxH